MPNAFNNDRDQHIDKVKQTLFAYMEAVRRRAYDECALIDVSLAQLGFTIRWREPQLRDDPTPRSKAVRF